MKTQSTLGGSVVNRAPTASETRIARVTSTADYYEHDKIEVVFLDYTQPCPVWVVGEIARKPEAGDMVLVSYIENRPDAPYLAGFLKNQTHCSNFMMVQKDKIRIQMPIVDHEQDMEEKLLNESWLWKRAYVEITPNGVKLGFPKNDGTTKTSIVEVKNGDIFFKTDKYTTSLNAIGTKIGL